MTLCHILPEQRGLVNRIIITTNFDLYYHLSSEFSLLFISTHLGCHFYNCDNFHLPETKRTHCFVYLSCEEYICTGSNPYVTITHEYTWVIMYIRTHPTRYIIGFVNNIWERTEMKVTFDWYIKSRTLRERRKVLPDFIKERWKTSSALEVLFCQQLERCDLWQEKKQISLHCLL